jgi:hypothetical protein
MFALAIGTRANVLHFLDEMTKPPSMVAPDQALIFTPDLLAKRLEWNSTVRAQPQAVAEDAGYIRVNKGTKPISFGVLRIHESDSGASLRLKLDGRPAPFHAALNWSRLPQPNVRIRLIQFALDRSFKEVPPSAVSAKIEPPTEKEPSPWLDIRWSTDHLLADREYLVDLRPSFEPSSVDFPGFVAAWSTPMSFNPSVTCTGFDGGRTQNLKEFVLGTWQSLLEQQEQEPSLGPVFIYFKK